MTNTLLPRREFVRLAGLGGLLLPSQLTQAQPSTVDAQTQFGSVRGLQVGSVNMFKGVPYGATTGGENRFMPPRDPAPWSGAREAFEYGPAAPQSDPTSDQQQDGRESEDCLVLNIWTRGIADGGRRPVMFWCHGGGFRSLSGSSPRYDGTNLALRGDVVVVTINHRLNLMGFTHFGDLGHPAFASSGTVGMQDVVQALRWVHRNIEEFGGDPDRVMVFGESGGGRKVATLLGMPTAKGLFHAAMIESGATLRLPDREPATELATLVLDELGLSQATLPRIQQVPLQRLMAAYHTVSATVLDAGGGTFAPTMDGDLLPHHPFWPVASPVNPEVPVIVGANRTEMTYFGDEAAFSLDDAEMRTRVHALVGADRAPEVVEIYQNENPGAPPSEIYFLIFSDYRYVMASITIAERRAALNPGGTYLYYLTWETNQTGRGSLSPHTLDIPFIFDNVRAPPFTQDGDTSIALADKISDTVIGFARTGNPNVGKLPDWTPYDVVDRATMVWNDYSQVVNDPIAKQRRIMQQIVDL